MGRSLLLACLLVTGSVGLAGATEDEPVAYERETGPLSEPATRMSQWGKPIFDVTVQRPLEAVRLAIGAVAFVPAYPLGWLFGGGRDVYEICLLDPWQRVFDTPLGEL